MPISEDVVVVGGGIAGSVAALSAAETGASVRLVTHKKSTLRHASGLVDVLGYTSDGDGPLVDPFEGLGDLPEGHPYRVVGEEAIREGLATFDEVVGDEYLGGHTDANALVPTHGGAVKPTARYPRAAAAGIASDDRDMLLVGFESMTDFEASLAAAHLDAAGVPFEASGVTVAFPRNFRADAKVTRFAKALDTDEDVGGRGTREALAATVEPHLDGAERVGFPSLLGDDRRHEVRADLEAYLDAEVFEVPMGPPSLPGLRLEDLLFAALDAAGVRISSGNKAVGYETDDGEVSAVVVDRKGREIPYHASAVVLATGGLVGKGIASSREGVREPLFDCYVPHPDDRYDWFVDDAFGDHPFTSFGVVPDDRLRPTRADGHAEFENLFAAGGVVGGANVAAEKSASGVSLATGVVAGREAGESA
ncbi:anaerobic glycerol-3-phosphate dehydrogenase subunit B [Salinigranum rubrum]|uniref:Anaerobic glycerol-3-phosphate dehydrogenase subunit B n=1 Tax=Salinigranum rubrum TaxID=755307 RepID=A0A2I8VPU7_9EURY|nr:glycerol-3-phosphate dehydrogenase subunit GlpB [Salinigranum rubrum]AUV83942.1 anaerobic glycerol-3-phosphate dehydrogenase subunit B [Salinigranum rubrum]